MKVRSNLAKRQTENAIKVMDALSAYLGGRFEPVIALCASNVVWRSIAEPAHAPFGGTFFGRDGVRRFFDAMFGAFEIYEPRVVDVIAVRDEVIHILKLEVRQRDGEAEGSAYVVGRWRFEDGLAVSYTDYFNVAAAIQTSTPSRIANDVTRDPSFAIYENDNALRMLDALAAYRGGRMGPLYAMLHPNVAWHSRTELQHAKFGGLFRGPDAVRTYFRRLSETLVQDDYIVADVIPAGPEVIHVADFHAHTIAEPRRQIFVRHVCIWTFAEGVVTGVNVYFDESAYLTQMK